MGEEHCEKIEKHVFYHLKFQVVIIIISTKTKSIYGELTTCQALIKAHHFNPNINFSSNP